MSIPSLTLWYYGCFELVLFAVVVHRVVVVKMRLTTPIQTGGKKAFLWNTKHKGKRNNNSRQDAASSLFNNCGGFTGDNYLCLRLHAPASGSTSGLKMCAGGSWPLREKIWEQHTWLPQGFSWPGKVIYQRKHCAAWPLNNMAIFSDYIAICNFYCNLIFWDLLLALHKC